MSIHENEIKERQASFLTPKKWMLWAALFLLFGAGFAIRFYDLYDAPLDFHPTRQMHSVLVARGMYYQRLETAPDWQRKMAVEQWKNEPHPEPQFLEALTATTYRVIDREAPWVARLYSIVFWMVGGIALFLLAKEIIAVDGALIALIYYLFLPYGAIASRSFQPDPLMVCLLIFTLWGIIRWQRQPTWGNTLLAGLLGGLAIFIKNVSLFFVAGAWIGLLFTTFGWHEILRSRKVWAAALLSLLPGTGFYVYGLFIKGFLHSELGLRFFPQLWKDPVFYLQWNSELSSVVGFEWFLIALVCTLLVGKKGRGMLLGLWCGYFAYGMTLSYHISTHDYYQLPLIPLVALGLGAGGRLLFQNFKSRRWLQYTLAVGVILFFIVLKGWDVRVALKRVSYESEIAFWQGLGEKLGQDVSVVGLLQDSGARLAYWGWVDTEAWLTSDDFNLRRLAGQVVEKEQLFDQAVKGKDYFVVTLLQELGRQNDLQNLLSNYAIFDQTDDYLIYDLRSPAQSDD